MTADQRTLAHPWIVAAIAAVALLGAWIVAVQDPVPSWELSLTTWFNDAPDWVAHTLWPIMQLGTLFGPVVVALIILIVRRDRFLALAVVISGLVTWRGASLVKHEVGRGRPRTYLPDINVRDGTGVGLGFVSGHSAMAAATALTAMAAIPRRWRSLYVVVLVAVVVAVGIARIVHGVHLPADVVGGWAFGTLIGVAGLTVVDRHRLRHPPGSTPGRDAGRGTRSIHFGPFASVSRCMHAWRWCRLPRRAAARPRTPAPNGLRAWR